MASHDSQPEPPARSWLFVDDDDGGVVRIELTEAQLRIGRDHSNDIWLDHPGCATHALVLYRRDGADHLKVYAGASVFLNGVSVAGMHRLYGGDTIRVTDRKFLYGNDATAPEQCLGVTQFGGDTPVRATIFRQTRVVIGRTVGDLRLDDSSVGEDHATLEFYSNEELFLAPGTSTRPITLDGAPLTRRTRLRDNAVVRLGRVQLRVSLLPSDGVGLMRPLAGPRRTSTANPPRMEADLGEPTPATVRSSWTPPPVDPVPATVIGALPSGQPAGALPRWLDDLKEDRRPQSPRPLSPRPLSPRPLPSDPAQAPRAQPASAQLERDRPGFAALKPTVRVAPTVFQGGNVHHDSRALRVGEPGHSPSSAPYDHGPRFTDPPLVASKSAASASAQPPGGLHEQMTRVLQIHDVRTAVAQHYAKPAQRSQLAADHRLPSSAYNSSPPEGGLYADVGVAAEHHTAELDVVADKPSLSPNGAPPVAQPSRRTASRRSPSAAVDTSQRRKPRRAVDDSPRFYDQQED